ncbi:MAG: aminotransferase class III-fold pyridoxal phosphate-dependent enzyme [Candidatus Thiodiazotropha taylori]|nr:aminotransferase class III-fold pyridoxal phosphate-dependent enzyme [Candidatus Thiodiazotropha taylori]
MNTTPAFGNLSLEEKRAAIKKLLGGSDEDEKQRNNGVFNPSRSDLLRAFRLDRPLVRGVGHKLYDEQGVEYLDFLSQYGAVSLGHNHAELWQAVHQMEKQQLPTMIQPLLPVAAQELSEKLSEITPGELDLCVFTNSGAEAVEAAIKLARARTGRQIILSTTNGFHGKTLGALSATGRQLYQAPFGAPVANFEHIPFGDLDALRSRLEIHPEQIAAFIVEPIQGEGGVVAAPPHYLAEAFRLCRQTGVLTILDEIQTGLGRTGSMFGLPEDAPAPDIMTLAKTLSGGLIPIGACITTPEVWDEEFGQLHSSTFANNNLACRVACKVIDILQRDNQKIIREVADNGKYLIECLHGLMDAYPRVIKAVRGKGFMTGLEFHPFLPGEGSGSMAFFSMNEGLMAAFSSYLFNAHRIVTAPSFNSSHTLRLQPPFTVGRNEIDRVIDALDCLCDALNRGDYHHVVQTLLGKSLRVVKGGKKYQKPEQQTLAPVREYDRSNPSSQFTFIVHYMYEQDFVDADPSFEQFSSEEMEKLRKWSREVGPGFVHHIDGVESKTGQVSEGWLMFLPMIPRDMVHLGRKEVLQMLEKAKLMAARRGSAVVGLGGFTSIVSSGGSALIGEGPSVTSGNTLTTTMAVGGIEEISQRVGMDLKQASVAVVGATGAIGRLVSLMLADRVGSMILVGNASNSDAIERCERIADEIYSHLLTDVVEDEDDAGELASNLRRDLSEARASGGNGAAAAAVRRYYKRPPILCTTNLDIALGDVDIVVAATNSDTAVIQGHHLRDWSIVCDVARPPNVSDDAGRASKALVFDGGLVELPDPVEFSRMGLPPGVCWGCLGETILLALESADGDHSIGQVLSIEEAAYITRLAEKHGFKPAQPHRFDSLIPDRYLDEFAKGYAEWRSNSQ